MHGLIVLVKLNNLKIIKSLYNIIKVKSEKNIIQREYFKPFLKKMKYWKYELLIVPKNCCKGKKSRDLYQINCI